MGNDVIRARAGMGPRVWWSIPPLLLWVLVASLAVSAASTAGASTVRPKPNGGVAGVAGAKTKIKIKTRTGASAKLKAKPRANAKAKPKEPRPAPEIKVAAIPPAHGKVAVFAFDGDAGGATPLRARVVRLLRFKGLQVTTTLRPVDSPEQYREMADTLGLAAFVDGEASEDGDQASVTVHVRSGVSGLRIASATLSGERRKLPTEVDRSLWIQIGAPLGHVCADAAKPRKHERAPMRIEAGTPLENSPADPKRDLKADLKKGSKDADPGGT